MVRMNCCLLHAVHKTQQRLLVHGLGCLEWIRKNVNSGAMSSPQNQEFVGASFWSSVNSDDGLQKCSIEGRKHAVFHIQKLAPGAFRLYSLFISIIQLRMTWSRNLARMYSPMMRAIWKHPFNMCVCCRALFDSQPRVGFRHP